MRNALIISEPGGTVTSMTVIDLPESEKGVTMEFQHYPQCNTAGVFKDGTGIPIWPKTLQIYATHTVVLERGGRIDSRLCVHTRISSGQRGNNMGGETLVRCDKTRVNRK